MKKNKVTKIIVYASTLAIASSGIAYTLLKKNFNDYKEYLSRQDKIVNDDFLVSAHRGFSSLAIENTKEAISFARDKEYIREHRLLVEKHKDELHLSRLQVEISVLIRNVMSFLGKQYLRLRL